MIFYDRVIILKKMILNNKIIIIFIYITWNTLVYFIKFMFIDILTSLYMS